MAAYVELPEWINERTVERAYRLAQIAQHRRNDIPYKVGMAAARKRSPSLLKALEGGSIILQRMSEKQMGVHGVDVGGIRVEATEYQMWKNAYTTADAGNPEENYAWIYASAAYLAGLVD
jgi:O-acetylhomoserine/O-acetylserine sulfhydrylase-like pyridoxal-dependent enzyme